MSAAVLARQGSARPHSRGLTLLLSSSVLVAIVGVLAATTARPTGPSAALVQRYQAAITPVVMDWGSVEVEGMRPAVADLQTGTGVPRDAIAVEARAWLASLEQDRARLVAAQAPPGLEASSELFLQALDAYLAAARDFGVAATAAPAARDAAISAGIASATHGDALYNQASMLLQRARRAAGLPTSPDFPDHPAAQG